MSRMSAWHATPPLGQETRGKTATGRLEPGGIRHSPVQLQQENLYPQFEIHPQKRRTGTGASDAPAID